MLELFHNHMSVCAAKVRITLAEKGLEWTGHLLDLIGGDQFRQEYLKLNPKSVVPTLVQLDYAGVLKKLDVGNEPDDA